MEIREFQSWLEEWDHARGWDRVSLAHTLVHALEEMGEVARLVLQWEGYKPMGSLEQLRLDLGEELSDLLIFLVKIAYQTGIDLEDALLAGQAKANRLHADLPAAAAELDRYERRQSALGVGRSASDDAPEPSR